MSGLGEKIGNEASEIIEAEKGKVLSPRNLHLRLRVIEIVLLISLVLNLIHWYETGTPFTSTTNTAVVQSE